MTDTTRLNVLLTSITNYDQSAHNSFFDVLRYFFPIVDRPKDEDVLVLKAQCASLRKNLENKRFYSKLNHYETILYARIISLLDNVSKESKLAAYKLLDAMRISNPPVDVYLICTLQLACVCREIGNEDLQKVYLDEVKKHTKAYVRQYPCLFAAFFTEFGTYFYNRKDFQSSFTFYKYAVDLNVPQSAVAAYNCYLALMEMAKTGINKEEIAIRYLIHASQMGDLIATLKLDEIRTSEDEREVNLLVRVENKIKAEELERRENELKMERAELNKKLREVEESFHWDGQQNIPVQRDIYPGSINACGVAYQQPPSNLDSKNMQKMGIFSYVTNLFWSSANNQPSQHKLNHI